jgi:hypothetical protein
MSFSVPAAYAGTPYTGTAVSLPGTVDAVNYDKGGEGVAYHDTDSTNDGGQYRLSEGVDIEKSTDAGIGYDVGWIESGEWLKYSVTVQASRAYTASIRVASGIAGGAAGSFHIEDETGKNLSGPIAVNSTGGWQVWTTVTANLNLTGGNHVLRVFFDSANGSFNINTIAIN